MVKDKADKAHKNKFKQIDDYHAWEFWRLLYLGIGTVALILAVLSLFNLKWADEASKIVDVRIHHDAPKEASPRTQTSSAAFAPPTASASASVIK